MRASTVPRRTGERSDDAELHTRELPSLPGSNSALTPRPSRVDPLFTGASASCTRGIGRATVLGIPEGVLRARPLPLRVEPTVSGTADGLHARDMPSVLDCYEGGTAPTATVREQTHAGYNSVRDWRGELADTLPV